MVQPIQYAPNIANPVDAFAGAYQMGATIRDDQRKQQLIEQEQIRQQQISAQYEKLRSPNATADDFANLAMILPKDQAEVVQNAWKTRSEAQNKATVSTVAPLFSSLLSGNKDVYNTQFDTQISAKRNSGDEAGAVFVERMKAIAQEDPMAVAQYFGSVIAPLNKDVVQSALDQTKSQREALMFQTEKAAKEATTRKTEAEAAKTGVEVTALQSTLPATVMKANAEAKKAATEARFLESEKVKELEKKGWDIAAIQNDIDVKKENVKIAAINAQINKEQNDIRREELQVKRQEMMTKRDELVTEKANAATSAMGEVDSALGVLNDVLGLRESEPGKFVQDEASVDALKAATGASAWRAAIWGTDARAKAGKISQLESALAMTEIPKLKGAMSDKDIQMIKAVRANLDRYQDEDKFIEELGKVQKALVGARDKIKKDYGLQFRAMSGQSAQPAAPAQPAQPGQLPALPSSLGQGGSGEKPSLPPLPSDILNAGQVPMPPAGAVRRVR